MRTYIWDEYYEKFFDWADSTRIRNLSGLTSVGNADEVAEVIMELYGNENAINRLMKKAVEANLAFKGSDLVEFISSCDDELLTEAVKNSASKLTAEDIEELYGVVDYRILDDICSKRNLKLQEELQDEMEEEITEEEYEEPQKLGFWRTLFAICVAVGGLRTKGQRKRHNGRCDGDCENCPPHYGYRYGRWYYGKGHVRGCQFGGNKGR